MKVVDTLGESTEHDGQLKIDEAMHLFAMAWIDLVLRDEKRFIQAKKGLFLNPKIQINVFSCCLF